jgi:threonine dehydratase
VCIKLLGQRLDQVHISDMFSAQERIRKAVAPTPLISAETLNIFLNNEVFLKAESLLPIGAYKFRGALNKCSCLKERYGDNIKIITASSGNHGMACAYVAKTLGITATVVVPEITPKIKIDSISKLGAEILVYGKTYDSSFIEACRLANENGYYYVHPVADTDTVAGQGTISLELMSQLPELEQIVVPLGGGGLIAGVSYAIKCLKPEVRIVGVMAKNSCVYYESRKAGRLVEIENPSSIADACVRKTGEEYLFPYIEKYVDDIYVVDEDSIKQAVKVSLLYGKLLLEGSGALPMAAALEGQLDLNRRTVLICSGGNIDLTVLQECIKE